MRDVGSRDRRGRGLRGPLVPPTVRVGPREVQVPLSMSRSKRFDGLVTDVIAALEPRWAERLQGVEFAVEDVPPDLPADGPHDLDGLVADQTAGGPVPLGRLLRGSPPRVVVYRRPLEARAAGRQDLAALVREVVLEQIGDLLGRGGDEL